MKKSDKLYAVGGLFDNPDKFINAVKAVSGAGYTKFDANTPYPVHGLDDAMRLKKTNIGLVTFIMGVLGAVGIFVFMAWTSASSYPLVIGGKPLVSTPAFIPITFEGTVLMAAVGTVLALLFGYLKLPYNAHPLHDSHYMESVSSNKLGLYVEIDDPEFDRTALEKSLKENGALEVVDIYYEEEDEEPATAMNFKFISGLVVLFLVVGGYTWLHLQVGLEILPFNWMTEQPKYSAQATTEFFANGSAMLPPVKGTVARGHLPYLYHDRPEEAAKRLINPLPVTEKTLLRGKRQYDIFCSVCHGDLAKGDSRLKDLFPTPPSLHSKKVREEWTDGRIFHVITDGQNTMPSYAKQIPVDDRWAIIHYIRVLQRSLNAKESDLK